jgi:hypothetical protein
MSQNYPDPTNLFAAKAQRRLELIALSWEEKIAIVTLMRQSLPKNAWRNKATREVTPAIQDSVPEADGKQRTTI